MPLHSPIYSSSIVHVFETLSPEDLAAQIVASANLGDEPVRRWLDEFVSRTKPRRGLVNTRHSDAALEQLADAAADVELTLHPTLDDDRRVHWQYSYSGEVRGDIHALALLRVIGAGLLPRIRYCRLADCGKLFFGDKRARWCSNACGSKYRQRQWRKEHGK